MAEPVPGLRKPLSSQLVALARDVQRARDARRKLVKQLLEVDDRLRIARMVLRELADMQVELPVPEEPPLEGDTP